MATNDALRRKGTFRVLVWALPLLGFLHVYPWFPGRAEPLMFGIVPMPLFLWIIWTVLLLALVAYIVFVRDPLAYIAARVRRLDHGDADQRPTP